MTKLPVSGTFSVTAIYGQIGPYWAHGHQGIDLICANQQIFSTCYGTVRIVSYDASGWGQYVSIGDSEGRRHIFCHLVKGSVTVSAGQQVTPLTVIGTMGATGNVTGRHLHYQLQQGATVIDPTGYLGIPNALGTYHSEDFQQAEEVNEVRFKDEQEIPSWAAEAVEYVSDQGLMMGDPEGTFRPNAAVTRAELALILWRLKG